MKEKRYLMSTEDKKIRDGKENVASGQKKKQTSLAPALKTAPKRRRSESTSQEGTVKRRRPESASQEGTVKRRRPESASQEGTVKRRRPESASQEGTVKRRRPESASQEGTVKRRRPESASQERTVKRRRPESGSQEGTVKRRRPENASQEVAVKKRPAERTDQEGMVKKRRPADRAAITNSSQTIDAESAQKSVKTQPAAESGSAGEGRSPAQATGKVIQRRRPEDVARAVSRQNREENDNKSEKKSMGKRAKGLIPGRSAKKTVRKEQVQLDPKKEAMRRKKVMITYIKTGAITLAAIAVILLIWNVIVKPIKTKSAWKQISDASSVEEDVSVATSDPEREDGSGEAGCALVSTDKHISYDAPGWQHDDNGWWYACDDSTCYINGWKTLDDQQYHFNENGYLDTGWVALGGQGYYFDEDGVYDPNKDASKLVALTFDDGPGEYTNQLLDILEQNGAVATFFMLGQCIESYGDDVIPRMIEMGCGLGNHSYDHTDMSTLSTEDCLKQFQTTNDLIGQYNGGAGATYYRFPYGSYTDEEEASIDHPSIYWDQDTEDWKTKDATTLAGNIVENTEGGNIILLHDIHEWSVESVSIFLPKLVEQGYSFVTLDELAASRGYTMEPNVTYFGFTDYLVENNAVDDKD